MSEATTHYTADDSGLAGDIVVACGAVHWAIVSTRPWQVDCEDCRGAIIDALRQVAR
jgi:hypothetical protein